jgi:hypothetical protein
LPAAALTTYACATAGSILVSKKGSGFVSVKARGDEDRARAFVGWLAACCFARASAVGQVGVLCCQLRTRFPAPLAVFAANRQGRDRR